jgi:hypothetical protein
MPVSWSTSRASGKAANRLAAAQLDAANRRIDAIELRLATPASTKSELIEAKANLASRGRRRAPGQPFRHSREVSARLIEQSLIQLAFQVPCDSTQ